MWDHDRMDTSKLERAARRYRDAEAALDAARTDLQTEAVDFLRSTDERGVQAAVVRITGWSREHLRRLKEKAEMEALRRKVEELSAADKPQPAVATPRAQVSAVVPTEPNAEATTMEPLPEMLPREFRKIVARAMSRAKPDQRERLNLTAKTAEQLGRNKDDEVLKAALDMGLLTHDEVYGTTEEKTA